MSYKGVSLPWNKLDILGHQVYAQTRTKTRSKIHKPENARARLHQNKDIFKLGQLF